MKKTLALLFTLCLLCFSGCDYELQKLSYYSEKDNYITVSGTVTEIDYYKNRLYINFTDMSEVFDDHQFIIEGMNYDLVIERGIEEHLAVGKTVSFTTAPEYFGDGYKMPIVAITIDDIEFLEFEEGYTNFYKTII